MFNKKHPLLVDLKKETRSFISIPNNKRSSSQISTIECITSKMKQEVESSSIAKHCDYLLDSCRNLIRDPAPAWLDRSQEVTFIQSYLSKIEKDFKESGPQTIPSSS